MKQSRQGAKRVTYELKRLMDPLASAWTGIISHKLRSFLTMLGIVIGVAAVIALMSIGKGTQASILSRIQGLGTNLLFINPGSTSSSGVRSAMGSATTLTQEDGEAILESVANVVAVAPTSGSFSQLVYGSSNTNARVTGITPSYQDISSLEIASGELITDYDVQSATKVCLLGATVATTLFGTDDAVGQAIRMGNNQVRVIGVLKSKGTTGFGSTDDAVFVPLTMLFQTSSRSLTTTGQHIVSSVNVQITDTRYATQITDDIKSLLRYRHRLATSADDDFSITSQEDIIKTISDTTAQTTFLLGAIAAISLLVGGIGVMNIMLVSVIERTREIGIRKALGAEEGEIIMQFLIEAALLCVGGGIIGIGIGWGASVLVGKLMSMSTVVTADVVILAFTVAAAIGLIFGLYPAWRGSRLNPIDALRYE
jgi:putative ABC transport system permease protein